MKKSKDNVFLFYIMFFAFLSISFIFFSFFFKEQLSYLIDIMSSLNLEDWRSIATIVYGIIGLSLGYWYFNKKIEIDKNDLRNDRSRNRLTFIYDELNRTDKLTSMILDLDISSNESLSKIRAQLDRMFLLINLYLDNNENLLGFSDDEIKSIIAVHSFIINSEILSSLEFKDLKKEECSKEDVKYIEILQEARTILLQKIESV